MQVTPPLPLEPSSLWEICSATDTNETADNLPGLGRTLGRFYAFVGDKLEAKLGFTAERMGFGPRAVVRKIQRIKIEDEDGYIWNNNRKKAQKKCKQLVQYVR